MSSPNFLGEVWAKEYFSSEGLLEVHAPPDIQQEVSSNPNQHHFSFR